MNSLDIQSKTVTMNLMQRAEVNNIPSLVRHFAVPPKIIINFWQE